MEASRSLGIKAGRILGSFSPETAKAFRLEAFATRLEAIASRLEAFATASRLEAIT